MPKLPAANLPPPKPPVNKPKSPSKNKEEVKKAEITPIQSPMFEIKSLPENKEIFQPPKSPMLELPKPEPPKQEIIKQEPLKQEPKPEPIKEEINIVPKQTEIKETQENNSSKSMEFKDIVKNLSFPNLNLKNAPKKDKKKLIVCVTHNKGTTATQEEVSIFILFFMDEFFTDSEILYQKRCFGQLF